MAKQYIYQLTGGNMLVFQDGWVGVEHTGYPLPDCRITVAGALFNGQKEVLHALLGYDIVDSAAFAEAVSKFHPMPYDVFKKKVITDNIGGGCPKWLEWVTVSGQGSHYGFNQAHFRHILPEYLVNTACTLPDEQSLVEEYGDLLKYNWVVHENMPNWMFRNNLILFTGCREVTDKHFEFIEDLVGICMLPAESVKYKYISGITLSNGNGAIVLCDSYIGSVDVMYLYQKVTGADLSVGEIVCEIGKAGAVTVKYKYVDASAKRRKMPIMSGVVKRKPIQ